MAGGTRLVDSSRLPPRSKGQPRRVQKRKTRGAGRTNANSEAIAKESSDEFVASDSEDTATEKTKRPRKSDTSLSNIEQLCQLTLRSESDTEGPRLKSFATRVREARKEDGVEDSQIFADQEYAVTFNSDDDETDGENPYNSLCQCPDCIFSDTYDDYHSTYDEVDDSNCYCFGCPDSPFDEEGIIKDFDIDKNLYTREQKLEILDKWEKRMKKEAEPNKKLKLAATDWEGQHDRHFWYHDGEYDHLEWMPKERARCQRCQYRAFSTHEKYPIYLTNDVDEECLPSSFRFIEASILDDGVEVPGEEFHTGCECETDLDCMFKECQCLQDMKEIDADEHGKIYSYHSQGDRKECLREAKLESRDPIYECHAGCSCSSACSNRVVERGRKIPLNIFKTEDGRGWGVKCPVNIKRGRFIDKYIGEIITSEEANKRRMDSDVAQQKDVYLFALDKFYDPDSEHELFAQPAYEVDGEFCSGPTRFINHSCDPNLRIFARVGDHVEKHIHDLAFFAIKDIPAGTELTFDYVDGVDTDLADDSNDPEKLKDMTKCLCGSEDCRGFLW